MAEGDVIGDAKYPYGRWVSDSGFEIRLDPDNTFHISLGDETDSGDLAWVTPREDGRDSGAPYLENFSSTRLGTAMMMQAGYYDRHHESNPDAVAHPSMAENVGEGDFKEKHCKGRPCRHFGGRDRPEFAFRWLG